MSEDDSQLKEYNSVYDVQYDFNGESVTLYDEVNDFYNDVKNETFLALVKAHFTDPVVQDRIIRRVYGGTKVKVSFVTAQAAVAPSKKTDYSELTMQMMNDTVGLKFKDKDQMSNFFKDHYGVTLS